MNRKKNPKMKQFNVRVTADELEKIRRVAWDENKSISTYIRGFLWENHILDSLTVKNNP